MTNQADKFEVADLRLSVLKLEEQILQMNALQTYIMDRNKWDINAIMTMLFTIPNNVDIIRQNLADPIQDGIVLDRVVAKWEKSVTVNGSVMKIKTDYKH